MTAVPLSTRLRFSQIRLTAKVLTRLAALPGLKSLLTLLGGSSTIDRTLVGFRATFPTFAAARAYAARYAVPSHEHPGNVVTHLSLSEAIRPSDRPVLTHLREILHASGSLADASVLDIGGSAGNLFYSYTPHLDLPPGLSRTLSKTLSWTVFEVPENVLAGRELAAGLSASRLHFIDDLAACTHAGIVLISGSLHYFEALPPELIRHLDPPPKHIFINRTPVIDGPTSITIQDAVSYYAISPARILSRSVLLASMAAAGYELVDEWRVPDLKFPIPLHPRSSALFYSGFYFRQRQPLY